MKKIIKYEEERPWGSFVRFTLNEKSSVKIITLKPKQKTSLQFHKKRQEFWKVLDNPIRVTVGKRTWIAKPGEEIQVKKKELHRLEGISKAARVLEISQGEFDEKDIVRVEDIYGR